MNTAKSLPDCVHCTRPVPRDAGLFCCPERELEALRGLMQEVTRNLDSEMVTPISLGDVNDATAFGMLRHTRERIRRVLGK